MKPQDKTFRHLGFIAFAGFAASSAHADTALTTGHTIIDTTGNPALGVISRSAGATALFDNNGFATATGTPPVNGILGPWAFIGTGTTTRYATLDGSNNVVSFTGGTTTTWGGTINRATTNYEISASGTATYGGSERVANTIRYTGGAGSVISLGNSSAAGLTVNGLINAGTAAITFQHGGGSLAGAGIHVGATKELVLNAANAAINVNARLHNNTGGASAVTVVGPNTVTLSAANTYTGATNVNAGTLKVSGSIGSSSVTVANNGILASGTTGTIGSSVSVSSGGTLAAGGAGAIGTATVGSGGLALSSGSIFAWDLAGATGSLPTENQGSYDKVVSNGTLSGTSIFNLVLGASDFTDTFWDTAHTWSDIFTGAGVPTDLAAIFTTFSGTGVDTNGTVTGQGGSSFNGSTTLTWSAVPEPATASGGLLLAAGLLRRRRA